MGDTAQTRPSLVEVDDWPRMVPIGTGAGRCCAESRLQRSGGSGLLGRRENGFAWGGRPVLQQRSCLSWPPSIKSCVATEGTSPSLFLPHRWAMPPNRRRSHLRNYSSASQNGSPGGKFQEHWYNRQLTARIPKLPSRAPAVALGPGLGAGKRCGGRGVNSGCKRGSAAEGGSTSKSSVAARARPFRVDP